MPDESGKLEGQSNHAGTGRKYSVLIADDEEPDRFFLKEAIRKHAPTFQVVGEVGDGEEVIAYLWGYGKYSDREKYPFPKLLIMDCRMPRITGIQVLEWLQTQKFPELKVALLADSSQAMFREKALSLGLNHFYQKAVNASLLEDVVKRLQAELEKNPDGCFL
jgi:DNA-binding NarL/FixJ family response regulator